MVRGCIWIQMSHPGAETLKRICDFPCKGHTAAESNESAEVAETAEDTETTEVAETAEDSVVADAPEAEPKMAAVTYDESLSPKKSAPAWLIVLLAAIILILIGFAAFIFGLGKSLCTFGANMLSIASQLL